MKKIVFGILIGIGLSFTYSVNAETISETIVSMIGQVVQGEFPVKVADKELHSKAIVVDGTSYLPVREFGEAIGYDVKFDADLGITLTKSLISDNANVQFQEQIEQNKKNAELLKQSNELTEQIKDLYKIIEPYENIKDYNGKPGTKEPDETYYETKKQRDSLIQRRNAIDKQLHDIIKAQQDAAATQ